MNFRCKLLALTAGLPCLMAAADPQMMSLVTPDASVLVEVNLARIMKSPIGAAIGESFHQGMTTQLKGELTKARPQFQEQIASLTNVDWSKDVQDILISSGTSKAAPMLIIVRTSLDAGKIQALKAFTGGATEFEGATILASAKPDEGVIAFLDNSIVVMGKPADVKSAIHRRNDAAVLPEALAAQVAKFGKYDLWFAAAGDFAAPAPKAATKGAAAGAGPGAAAQQYLEKIAGFNGGLRFSPDFDLSADIEARTEKAATEMSQSLQWLTSALQAQAKSSGKGMNGLESLKFQVAGKRILLSLHVPEAQVRAGIMQMKAAQANRVAAVRTAPTVHPALTTPQVTPDAPPASQLGPPPAGTIRVQSSEGTVLIPVGKDQ